MRLRTFSDYSLRVLIYLGLHTDHLITISELADAYQISRNHLMKVVSYMAQHHIVETVRGQGGGVRLAMPPGDIWIGDILRETEADTSLVECFRSEENTCRILPACTLHHYLQQAEQAFYDYLNQYSLQDLLQHPQDLNYYLDMQP